MRRSPFVIGSQKQGGCSRRLAATGANCASDSGCRQRWRDRRVEHSM